METSQKSTANGQNGQEEQMNDENSAMLPEAKKRKIDSLPKQQQTTSDQDPTTPKMRAPLVKKVPGNKIYVRYNGLGWRINTVARPKSQDVVERCALPGGQPDVDMAQLDDAVVFECSPSSGESVLYVVMSVKSALDGGWSLVCGQLVYDTNREQFWTLPLRSVRDQNGSITNVDGYDAGCLQQGCAGQLLDPSQALSPYSKEHTPVHWEKCQLLLASAQVGLLDAAIREQLMSRACRLVCGRGLLRADVRLEHDSTREVALVQVPAGQQCVIANNIVSELPPLSYQGQNRYYESMVQKLRFIAGLDADSWRPCAYPDVEEIKTRLTFAEPVALTVWNESMSATKLLFLWRSNAEPESGGGYMTLAYKVDGAGNGSSDASSDWQHTPVHADYGRSRRQEECNDDMKQPEFLWYTDNDDAHSCRKLPVSEALIQYCGCFAKEKAMPGTQNN